MTEPLQSLRRLYKKPDARAVIDSLVTLPTGSEMTVNTITMAAGVDHLAVIHVLKDLQKKVGCGKFVVGRHGNASRMQWSVDPRRLRAAAIGELEELPRAFKPDPNVEVEIRVLPTRRAGPGRSVATDELLTHQFILKSGREVTFKLPRSLTQSDAERLAKFILSLPFD